MSQIFEFFFPTKFQITAPHSEQKNDKRKIEKNFLLHNLMKQVNNLMKQVNKIFMRT